MSANINFNSYRAQPGDECAICLENFEAGDKITRLACNHFFHQDCISGLNSCPMDRRRITHKKDYMVPRPELKKPEPKKMITPKPASIEPVKIQKETAKKPLKPKQQHAGSALAWMVKMGIKV